MKNNNFFIILNWLDNARYYFNARNTQPAVRWQKQCDHNLQVFTCINVSVYMPVSEAFWSLDVHFACVWPFILPMQLYCSLWSNKTNFISQSYISLEDFIPGFCRWGAYEKSILKNQQKWTQQVMFLQLSWHQRTLNNCKTHFQIFDFEIEFYSRVLLHKFWLVVVIYAKQAFARTKIHHFCVENLASHSKLGIVS